MQIVISIIITLIVAVLSWYLPNFKWRATAVLFSAFLSANLAYLFALWLYPDSEISSWKGIIINSSFYFALCVGVYIVFVIQVIKLVGERKKIS